MTTAMMVGKILITICGCALLYTYLLFPILLLLASCFRPPSKQSGEKKTPLVTIIFAFVNETQELVKERIENLLTEGYENLEVIAVCDDKSRDDLAQLEEQFSSQEVTFCRTEEKYGKTAAQNLGVEKAKGEILVFTDANTRFDKGAIEQLVTALSVDNVGCVVGQLTYSGRGAESDYWSIENLLKKWESRFYSVLGANGAIYALRRKDYVQLPPQSLSDFVEPILILLFQSKRTLFLPNALAREEVPTGYGTTFQRKGRIVFRALKSLPLILPAINPLRDFSLAWLMWSHKLLRWASSFLFAGLLLGLLLYLPTSIHLHYFLALSAITLLCLLIFRWEPPIIGLMAHFVVTLAALCWAFSALLRGLDARSWQPSTKN